MATVAQVLRNFQALNLRNEVKDTIRDTEKELIAIQIEQRKTKGIGGDGQPFKPYSEWYKKYKAELGFDTSVVNLTLFGDFNREMTVDVHDDNYTVKSLDAKFLKLIARDGDHILETAPEFKDEYIRTAFWPTLKKRIEKVIKIELK